MSQIPPRLNPVTHALLQNLRLGESPVGFAIPQQDVADGRVGGGGVIVIGGGGGGAVGQIDGEEATRGGSQGDFAEGGAEGREKFLRVVGGA
jgi:hypothetical protein